MSENLALLGASRKSFPTLVPTKVFEVFGVTVTACSGAAAYCDVRHDPSA